MEKTTVEELYAQLYDARVPDWDGEVEFYRALIRRSALETHGVLEIACGTGRIAVRLAEDGVPVTGLDRSPELLAIAREKSAGLANAAWVLADMRTFELGRQFGLVISPGHSFQFMTTPDDQAMCLECIRRHLVPDGLAVLHLDHQDYGWLAGILDRKEPVYEREHPLTHPVTRRTYRRSYAWEFEPSTQTATLTARWEELDAQGDVIQVLEMEPMRLHCIFPFEMEHLLRRAGFCIEAVYGDFFENGLSDASDHMIWLARNAPA